MTSLQITFIVAAVLIFVTAIITYFVRGKYYDQIDALDQQKKQIFTQAPREELKEVRELSITGQSLELREKLENEWNRIESIKYPELENYLFAAEQATDRYRLNESKKNQDHAKKLLHDITTATDKLSESLTALIEQEQANLKKIETIKKRYHEVRKSLLAYSFSFGPASETFEEKLNSMEEDFTEFSEYTLSGDHEEANKVIKRLDEKIHTTEAQMEQIPPLLAKINEEYEKDIEDLRQGYEKMLEHNYLFPEDTILEEIDQLNNQKSHVLENIRLLELEAANTQSEQLRTNIEEVYDKMEAEIISEPKVFDLLSDIKEAIYFLKKENKRLVGIEHRLSQSYVLVHGEKEKLLKLDHHINEALKEYQLLEETITEHKLPYSIAHTKLTYLFKELNQMNDKILQIISNLESYRKEELHFKNELTAMEQAMYDMKRALENERLPGLPDNYLELFFSTTDRIELLVEELSQMKVSLPKVRKIHQVTEEDVLQLSRLTEELIVQVNLIERVSQRLYRFRDSHKGILETIRYSESLFNDNYDYDTALRLLREKLENVAPGNYDKIVSEYKADKDASHL